MFRSTQQFQAILDAAPSLVFWLDNERRLLWANRAATGALGIDVRRVAGLPIAEVCPWDAAWLAEDRSGDPDAAGGRIERLAGRWVLATETLLPEAGGDPCRRLIIATDVTAQREAETERQRSDSQARKSNSRFLTAIESSPVAMLIASRCGEIVTASREAEELFGYGRGEMIGMPVDRLVPPRQREQHARDRQRFQREPSARRMAEGRALVGVRRDGSEVEVEVGLQPFANAEGDFVLATITDPARRNHAERALRASEAKYRTLFDRAPVMHASFAVDDGTILECNSLLAERIAGGEKRGVVGRRLIDLHAAASQPAVAEALIAFAQTGLARNADLALAAAGGDLPVILQLAAVPGSCGGVALGLATWVDVGDLKRQAAELERVNRELEDFTRVASHDLKAPLRAVDHLTSWIEEDLAGRLAGESRRHLTQLRQRVRRMEALLDDLLTYAKAGRQTGAAEEIDLEAVVAAAVAVVAPPSGFRFERRLRVGRLGGHKMPLSTVLRNLIENAYKHHGGVSGRVGLEAEPHAPREARIVVWDDGQGIPPEMTERVFSMFQTLRPRDQVEGSGIGLPLVKKHVEAEGGRVWIERRRPTGVRVCFTWPLAPGADNTTR